MSNEVDGFDEIFFQKHGVGQFAKDPEYEAIANTLDKTQPTLDEREFCRYILKGDSNAEAYRKVFDKGNEIEKSKHSGYASTLLKRNRVAEYMYDLRKEAADMYEETLPNLIAELNEDRKLARDMGQPGAAIQAVKTKASLLGMENQNNVTNNITLTITDEQREALLKRVGGTISPVRRDEIVDAEFEDVSE